MTEEQHKALGHVGLGLMSNTGLLDMHVLLDGNKTTTCRCRDDLAATTLNLSDYQAYQVCSHVFLNYLGLKLINPLSNYVLISTCHIQAEWCNKLNSIQELGVTSRNMYHNDHTRQCIKGKKMSKCIVTCLVR